MTAPALHRPKPAPLHDARAVDRTTPPAQAAARLRDGERLRVADHYRTGKTVLEHLFALLDPPPSDATWEQRRVFRHAWREVSPRLLAPIVDHRVALAAAPRIHFLPELYPDLRDFALPFVDVRHLYDAWRVYDNGIHFAVLGYKLHPFYGTYAPKKVLHLELFATWLSQYEGARTRAIDVGTGCGVLALMLCRAGFDRVLATDTSPNAIESVRRDLKRLPARPPIDLHTGDLLGEDATPADLIVFNPPWVKGTIEAPLDRALTYDDDGLFERFFDQASARLAPGGRVVLVFSNILRLVQPDVVHPIDAELERGRFELVHKLHRRAKPAPGPDGRARRTRERVEVWELRGT